MLHINFVFGKTNTAVDIKVEIDVLKSQEGLLQTDSLYINTLIDLAAKQRYYSLDSLQTLASKALSLSKKSNYKKGESKSYSLLGDFYSDQGKHDEAIHSFNNAFKLANDLENTSLLLSIINDLAGEYGYKGDYAMALKEYLVGIELAEVGNNKLMLSILNENIAELYLSQKDFEQAMLFYKRVKRINDEIGDSEVMAETMSNMASAYADMGELDLAMFNINSSIRVFEEEKIMDWLAYAYEIKGKVYLKQKKYDWAMYWYKQSELIHKDLEDERAEIALLN